MSHIPGLGGGLDSYTDTKHKSTKCFGRMGLKVGSRQSILGSDCTTRTTTVLRLILEKTPKDGRYDFVTLCAPTSEPKSFHSGLEECRNVIQTIHLGPELIKGIASAAEIYLAVNDVNTDPGYK